MSSVVRTEDLQVASGITLAATTTTLIDLPRPQTTPTEPPYAQGTDHVVRPTFLREEEAGVCVVDLPTSFISASVFVGRISIHQLLPTPQTGVQDPSTAFFPTGAPEVTNFVRDLFADPGYLAGGNPSILATNSDSLRDLLGNLRAGAAVRSYPGISVRAGEYVHLELYNSTGSPIGPANINVVYKLGLNQANDPAS
jgi:hypothetical protein